MEGMMQFFHEKSREVEGFFQAQEKANNLEKELENLKIRERESGQQREKERAQDIERQKQAQYEIQNLKSQLEKLQILEREREREREKERAQEAERYKNIQAGTARLMQAVCQILASNLLQPSVTKTLPESLQDLHSAQTVVDFLNCVLDQRNILQAGERKRALHLLCKLAKSAQVFPKSVELTGVECDFRQSVNEGGFGLIYKGRFEGETVCVKAVQMYQAGAKERALRAHAGELILGCHVSHPNILPFYGAFISNEKRPRICITSPWMEGGNLVDYLHGYPDTPRVPLVFDILSGLQYLHELEIVHGDLKASNVLISRNGRAILGDFGVSRIALSNVGSTTAADFAGTTNWMAPELLIAEDTPPPTRESDIWAFGCICYEILAGKIPFEGYKPAQLIRVFIKGSAIPLLPALFPDIAFAKEIWSLAETCLHYDPSKRSTANSALEFIRELRVDGEWLPVAANS